MSLPLAGGLDSRHFSSDGRLGFWTPAQVSRALLPRYMERSAYLATAWRLSRHYRTYPAFVQDEVQAALDDPGSQFQPQPADPHSARYRDR